MMSIDSLRQQLPGLSERIQGRLLSGSDEMAPHLIDWRKRMRGHALAVVMPENSESVAAVIRWCVYLPEPESEFVVGRPELFDPDVDAFLCLVEGTQDGDLLFETPGAASGATIHHRTGEENGG